MIVGKKVEIETANAHSPSHTIKKKIRLCLDPKDLNNSLEREPYYSRSIDELIAKFSGAVIFTIVNMDKGYWQVELHPESRQFHFGDYQSHNVDLMALFTFWNAGL